MALKKCCNNCRWIKEFIKDNGEKKYFCIWFQVKITSDLIDKDCECEDFIGEDIEK